jgi:hypothetical protein
VTAWVVRLFLLPEFLGSAILDAGASKGSAGQGEGGVRAHSFDTSRGRIVPKKKREFALRCCSKLSRTVGGLSGVRCGASECLRHSQDKAG